MKKEKAYKVPRNEFHFYLQRNNRFHIHKNRKKIIDRKKKYKNEVE